MFALGIGIVALYVLSTRSPDAQALQPHLGGEYFNIARALLEGRGFSDPFGERTGPTAWMPPLYPALLAGLLSVLETRRAVGVCVTILTCSSLVLMGAALYDLARKHKTVLPPLVVLILFVAWLTAFRLWFFVLTTDVWLLASIAALVLTSIVEYVTSREIRPWRWGAIGGMALMASPTLAVAAGGMFLLAFSFRNRERRRAWLLAGSLAVALALPWTIRNYVTFGRVVVAKSNLMFEAYQANVVDQDGIYDTANMAKHPYSDPHLRFKYAKLGETSFISSSGEIFWREVAERPGHFVARIVNRLLAATLIYVPSLDDDGPIFRRFQSTMYALPLVAFLLSAWIKGRNQTLTLVLAALMALYLLPYIVVALYARYVLPMTPVLVFLAFMSLDRLVDALLRRIGSREPELAGPSSGG